MLNQQVRIIISYLFIGILLTSCAGADQDTKPRQTLQPYTRSKTFNPPTAKPSPPVSSPVAKSSPPPSPNKAQSAKPTPAPQKPVAVEKVKNKNEWESEDWISATEKFNALNKSKLSNSELYNVSGGELDSVVLYNESLAYWQVKVEDLKKRKRNCEDLAYWVCSSDRVVSNINGRQPIQNCLSSQIELYSEIRGYNSQKCKVIINESYKFSMASINTLKEDKSTDIYHQKNKSQPPEKTILFPTFFDYVTKKSGLTSMNCSDFAFYFKEYGTKYSKILRTQKINTNQQLVNANLMETFILKGNEGLSMMNRYGNSKSGKNICALYMGYLTNINKSIR